MERQANQNDPRSNSAVQRTVSAARFAGGIAACFFNAAFEGVGLTEPPMKRMRHVCGAWFGEID